MGTNLYTAIKQNLPSMKYADKSLLDMVENAGAFLSVDHLLHHFRTHYTYENHGLDEILYVLHEAFDDPRAYFQVVNAFDRQLRAEVKTQYHNDPAKLAHLDQSIRFAKQRKNISLINRLQLSRSYPNYADTLTDRAFIELLRPNPIYHIPDSNYTYQNTMAYTLARKTPSAGLQAMIANIGKDNLRFCDLLRYAHDHHASKDDYDFINSVATFTMPNDTVTYLVLSLLSKAAEKEHNDDLNQYLNKSLRAINSSLSPAARQDVAAVDIDGLTAKLLSVVPPAAVPAPATELSESYQALTAAGRLRAGNFTQFLDQLGPDIQPSHLIAYLTIAPPRHRVKAASQALKLFKSTSQAGRHCRVLESLIYRWHADDPAQSVSFSDKEQELLDILDKLKRKHPVNPPEDYDQLRKDLVDEGLTDLIAKGAANPTLDAMLQSFGSPSDPTPTPAPDPTPAPAPKLQSIGENYRRAARDITASLSSNLDQSTTQFLRDYKNDMTIEDIALFAQDIVFRNAYYGRDLSPDSANVIIDLINRAEPDNKQYHFMLDIVYNAIRDGMSPDYYDKKDKRGPNATNESIANQAQQIIAQAHALRDDYNPQTYQESPDAFALAREAIAEAEHRINNKQHGRPADSPAPRAKPEVIKSGANRNAAPGPADNAVVVLVRRGNKYVKVKVPRAKQIDRGR
jgi:hypothetical protein